MIGGNKHTNLLNINLNIEGATKKVFQYIQSCPLCSFIITKQRVLFYQNIITIKRIIFIRIRIQKCFKWKGINRKQSTRWQHLSWLKASAFFSLQKKFCCYETQQLILGTGTAIWWVTEPHCCFFILPKTCLDKKIIFTFSIFFLSN